jgi:hypothetical protein
MLNLAHNLNRQGRHDETEEVALDLWHMLQQNSMYAGRKAESIESLKSSREVNSSKGRL